MANNKSDAVGVGVGVLLFYRRVDAACQSNFQRRATATPSQICGLYNVNSKNIHKQPKTPAVLFFLLFYSYNFNFPDVNTP